MPEIEKYKKLLQNYENMAMLVDENYKVIWLNKAGRSAFGEREGQVCFELLYKEGQVCESCQIKKAQKKGELLGHDLTKGNYRIRRVFLPLEKGMTMVLFTVEEVTRGGYTDFEKFLIKRDRDKYELISKMAHELKSPLSIIRASLDLFESDKEEDREMIADIDYEIGRMKGILEQSLALLRLNLKEERRAAGEASKIIENIIRGVHRHAGSKGQNIIWEGADKDFEVCAEIEQVAKNLIENAVKHSGPGEIQIRIDKKDDQIILEVEDSGPPILPELREKIFESWWRGEESREGTGLGLHIARQAAEKCGGSLILEVGKKGNIFRATFEVLQSK